MTRSEVMSRIHSSGTRLEDRFRRLARQARARIRRADKMFGKPDFRILGTRTLVFVNSCFWHGCRWHCRMPGSRRGYWVPKIKRNVERQRQVVRKLRRSGYDVLVVWEHSIDRTPARVLRQLRGATPRI
jgi:DNA mismatch endonuclease (patch repair protein)